MSRFRASRELAALACAVAIAALVPARAAACAATPEVAAEVAPMSAPADAATAARRGWRATFASVPVPREFRFPTPRDRVRDWALNAFGPSAIAGDVGSAAWGQWGSGEPEEWPDDRTGFGRRLGAAAATTAITETSFSLMSAALRQDYRYYRCASPRLGRRIAYAVEMTFVARKPDGRAELSLAKTFGPFVGPLVTRTTLYPERYTWADGALSGAFAVLMNAGWNLAREFVLPAPR